MTTIETRAGTREYCHRETVTVEVGLKHILAAPRPNKAGMYSGRHTPLALALNDALGGVWTENDAISRDRYGYNDIQSGLVTRRTGILRSVTLDADAYDWMARWLFDGPESVTPRQFTLLINIQRPFNGGYGGRQ